MAVMIPDLDIDQASSEAERWSSLLLEAHFSSEAPELESGMDGVFYREEPSDHLNRQIQTHLQCLGYLGESTDGKPWDQKAIFEAFEKWQREDEAARSGAKPSVLVAFDGEDLDALTAFERDVRFLKAQCGFEGEVTLRRLTGKGSELATRIAAYRRATFGYTEDADLRKAVSALLGTVRHPCEALNRRLELALLNLLGDAPWLTVIFLHRFRARCFLIHRRSMSEGGSPFRPARTPSKVAAAEIDEADFFRRKHKPFHPRDHPELESDPPLSAGVLVCEFATRLLQLKLWMLGYYTGAIDGNWGTMAHQALEQFVAEHEPDASLRSGGPTGGRLFRNPVSRTRSTTKSYIIDVPYLLTFIHEDLDAVAESADLTRERLDDFVHRALGLGGGYSVAAVDRTTPAWKKASETEVDVTASLVEAHEARRGASLNTLSANGTRNSRRRRYFGWRAVFSFLGRTLKLIGSAVRDATNWIIEKVRQLPHYATAILNHVRETTRRAVKLVALGFRRTLHWLRGTPIVTSAGGEFVLTRWSPDFDTINFSSTVAARNLVPVHLDHLRALNEGFGFLVELALTAWRMFKALASGNWVLVAWQAFKILRNLIRSWDLGEDRFHRLVPAVI